MCPGADPHDIVRDPLVRWKIYETSFKPWPACRHAHPAIDAALDLRSEIDAGAVKRIAVRTYGDALAFCDRAEPRTPIDAKFSLQHSVAVALLDGPPPLEAFEPAAIARADVAALRAKVEVAAAEPYVSAYPARYGAEVEVELADGTRRIARMPDALGDPENPLSVEGRAREGAHADAARRTSSRRAPSGSPTPVLRSRRAGRSPTWWRCCPDSEARAELPAEHRRRARSRRSSRSGRRSCRGSGR